MGCASYKPVMSTNDVYKDKKIDNRIVASKNDISIDLIPIKNRRIANEYLGIDPYSTEILPVLIKIKRVIVNSCVWKIRRRSCFH